jgi:6-phosphogluconolactonase
MLAKTVLAVGLVAILASCGSSSGYSYTVGGTISGLAGSGLVLQNNAGDDLIISTNGSFSFAKALTDGSTYAVTVKTVPSGLSQSCTVVNGNGTVNRSPMGNVVVSCVTPPPRFAADPSGEFAYAANYRSNNVSAYTIDQTTGALQ